MLLGLVYVFAIIMFTLLKDHAEELIDEDKDMYDEIVIDRFERLGMCMWTLLVDGTFMDGIGLVTRALIKKSYVMPLIVMMVFVLASALTVMNMLIGVLCEVVSAVAAAEKEAHAVAIVKDRLLYMLKAMDEDGSGQISKTEIKAILRDAGALQTLRDLHVDPFNLMDQLAMNFEESPELSIFHIMDTILMLRGDRPPTMKDLLESMTFNRWKLNKAAEDLSAKTCRSVAEGAAERAVSMWQGSSMESSIEGARYTQLEIEPASDGLHDGGDDAPFSPGGARSPREIATPIDNARGPVYF